jgi:hypothetical protein
MSIKKILFALILGTFTLFAACKKDECVELTWFEDADGDGLGNPDVSVSECDQPHWLCIR